MASSTEERWTRARLIPVSGISSDKEAEARATSAVLAVLSVVRDLSTELFSPMGAPRAVRATVETYTEPQFVVDGRKIRPDGVIRIGYGKTVWTALVEVKTGDGRLEAEQINAYWEIARQNKYDAVVTISNEIAASPGSHPTDGLRVRSNSPVQVHHISWTALLSTAVTIRQHKGVADPEQAWLIGELIRYLEHSASGSMAFDDMGPNWVTVRDAARDASLRKNDPAVVDVAVRWDQLLRYAALQLGAQTGANVQHVLSRAHQDQKTRVAYLTDALAAGRPIDGTLRVPHTIGDIDVCADIKAGRISAVVTIPAPEDRGGKGRCSWLVNQLRDAPGQLVVEAYGRNARTPITSTLAQAIENRDVLLGDDKREPVRFRVVLSAEMGAGRKSARKPGFIDSILNLLEAFYGTVVQSITTWSPKAPKITAPATTAASVDDDDNYDDENGNGADAGGLSAGTKNDHNSQGHDAGDEEDGGVDRPAVPPAPPDWQPSIPPTASG